LPRPSRASPTAPSRRAAGSASAVEIERKWLAGALPVEVAERQGTTIEQGYLTSGRDGPEVRVRRRGDRCTLTVKGAGDLARTEVELPLSAPEFEALWPLTEGRRVVKTRVVHPLANALVAEVDRFEDRTLVLVEVEFARVEQAREFVPPEWFGRDVTGEAAYRNRNLAR
jgi:adenylate cyclase